MTSNRHLHLVMDGIVSLPPSHQLPSLIILAHKADLLKTTSASSDSISLAVNRVQTVLERELEKRRISQSGGMGIESMGGEDEKSEIGGLECSGPDSTFKFENWDGGERLAFEAASRSSFCLCTRSSIERGSLLILLAEHSPESLD